MPINDDSAVVSLSVAVAAYTFIHQWPDTIAEELRYTYDLARRNALEEVIRARSGDPGYTLP